MSADNYVGVWFDGTMWRVAAGLSASDVIRSREQVERMFKVSGKFPTREMALEAAGKVVDEGEYEYGVVEVEAPAENSWDDRDDEWTAEIDAAFPTRSGSHEEYATAMKMVGNRHSKQALVALVCWLLVKAKTR